MYANRDVEQAKKDTGEISNKRQRVYALEQDLIKDWAKIRNFFSRELERAVEIAYELGAKVVNHYCYHVAMGPEISFSELEKYYGRAIRKAKHRKIYLALENEAHDITQSPEGMKTIVEHMNSEYFKTNFDATNYYQAGYEGFPYAYEVLKEYIVHVHIKNGCFYHPEFGHEKQCRGGKMTGMFAGNDIYYPICI